MFCPKCATQNVDGASYCRSCGANISLLPQALTGNLPEAQRPQDEFRSKIRKRRDREIEPSIERGILNIFAGFGFIVAALAILLKFPGGIFWGWTFLIPGFQHLGRGVASIVAARRQQAAALPSNNAGAFPPRAYDEPIRSRQVGSPAPQTNELMPHVPSVTEGTTRHLGTEAPTQHFDSLESQKPS